MRTLSDLSVAKYPGKPPEGIENREPDEGLANPAILKPRIILR